MTDTRQCGRCRLHFPDDPERHPTARPQWWLCSECRVKLLGGKPRPEPASSTRRPVPGTSTPKRLERAQVVWQRARGLVDAAAEMDGLAVTDDLLRAAHQDPTQLAHALSIGRNELAAASEDEPTRRAVLLLEAAVAFVGSKPIRGEASQWS